MIDFTVSTNDTGQRLDNFLLKSLRGVPKSRIYKMLRKGSIRVNKGRKKPDYRIKDGDIVRVPYIDVTEKASVTINPGLVNKIKNCILYEDDHLLVVDKPEGLAVHSGSGLRYGLIDILSAGIGDNDFVQLAHRLDRDTSGCIIIAKSMAALRSIQAQINKLTVVKEYLALVAGNWNPANTRVDMPLLKITKSGERMMVVDEAGKPAVSHFKVVDNFEMATLVSVRLETGRTHQIRAHTAYSGHAIAGDSRYGAKEFNIAIKKLGLKRMFLHARNIRFTHPDTGKILDIHCNLPESLRTTINYLEAQ